MHVPVNGVSVQREGEEELQSFQLDAPPDSQNILLFVGSLKYEFMIDVVGVPTEFDLFVVISWP